MGIIAGAVGLALLGLVVCGGDASAQFTFKVTLLGTGTPTPNPNRFGAATLVEAGNKKFLIDAGRGVGIRLLQAGVPMGTVDVLLLTHFHSDHVIGIPDLWLSGWAESPYGQRKGPFRVTGPTGTLDLMNNLEKAYSADVKIRLADEKRPEASVKIEAKEYTTDGVVFDSEGVKVTAFEVDHGDLIKPAYGYRIDFDGRSALVSGDTRLSENLIKHGTGVNLLVHSVAVANPEVMKIPLVQAIMAHHTPAKDGGTVFARTKPKLAVYTHLVTQNRADFPPVGVKEIIEQTRETYDGPLQVGEDLMAFEVLPDEVKVIPPKKP